MELIKKITKAGNSSNILLPKEWLGGTARVELIEKPINIKEDILRILNPYLNKVIGIYLTGSYARGEETKESDVDILVITTNLDKKVKEGRYEVILISRKNLDRSIKNNAIPLLLMIKESKTIVNEDQIKKYKNIKPTKRNLKRIYNILESSIKLNEKSIILSEELDENVSDGIVYSLILSLRSAYTIDCLKKDNIPTTKGLRDLVFKLAGTNEPYTAYLRSKKDLPDKKRVSPKIAKKINNFISLKMSNIQKS